MTLKLAATNTEDSVQRTKELKKMFIDLQCPRCKVRVRSQADVDRLRETCKQCGRNRR